MARFSGGKTCFKLVYIREAHLEDKCFTSTGETRSFKPSKNIDERIENAERFVSDLDVKGDVFVDKMDDSFCTSYNAWPARCFIIKNGVLEMSSGLLGFRNENKALKQCLEDHLINSRQTTQLSYDIRSVRLKTVLVGDKSCGKTTLYTRFAKGYFLSESEYIPSVFEHYVADFQVDGKDVELALWDTCGGDEYEKLRPLSYPDTDVLLLMFSFGSSSSLENCSKKFGPEVGKYCPGVPIILVGGKRDLAPNDEKGTEKYGKPVTTDEGQAMMEIVGAIAYVECSSKTGEGVKDVFNTAVRKAFEVKKQKKPKRCCRIM